MKKYFKMFKILCLAALLCCGAVLALDTEYKNTLEKVEVTKAQDGSYNVKLYTTSPSVKAKVIKKSELSYYILLPETKDKSTVRAQASDDIRHVSTSSYPYAGTGENNGYTKINISTTKPVDFTVNTVSTSSAKVAQKPSQEQPKQQPKQQPKDQQKTDAKPKIAQAQPSAPAQTQNAPKTSSLANANSTKTSAQNSLKASPKSDKPSPQTSKSNNILASLKDKKVSETKASSKTSKTTNKIAKNSVDTKNAKTLQTLKKAQNTKKIQNNKQKIASSVNINSVANSTKTSNTKKKVAASNTSALKTSKQNTLPPDEKLNTENLIPAPDEDAIASAIADDSESLESNSSKDDIPVLNEDTIDDIEPYDNGFNKTLKDYGISLFDILIMLLAGILSFFVAHFILSNRSKIQARLKNKADLADKSKVSAATLHPKKKAVQERQGIFKKFDISNHKRMQEPITPDNFNQKPLEIPALPDDRGGLIEKAKYLKEMKKENQIIQNMLSDNTRLSDYEGSNAQEAALKDKKSASARADSENSPEILATPQPKRIQKRKYKAPAPIQIAEPVRKQESDKDEDYITEPITVSSGDDDAVILSSVEIAPQRGFMCVSYNDNINLIGYILDDVFALYNFNKPKLENYKIKFRLAEKSIRAANFIVKVDKSKLLVKVTKTSMSMEVVM